MGAEPIRELKRGGLHLRSEFGGDRHVVGLSGELDMAAVDLLQEEVDRVSGDRIVVLDLSELGFIDSAGIHMLLKLDAASRSNGGRLRMIRGSGAVQRVLELTGADRQLPYLD